MHWLLKTPIAHRGLHHGATIPENSLAAFERAMQHHFPIELDIHHVSDGNLAVFHDLELSRMTGIQGTLAAQNASTLKSLKLLETDQSIPLLDEVLELINGKVPILIEIKTQGKVGALEQALYKTLSHYRGDYAIQSFHPDSVAWFKHNAPQIMRGQLAGHCQPKDIQRHHFLLQKNRLINWAGSPHFIGYNVNLLPNLSIAIARRIFNIPILAWTIKTELEKVKALTYADNIIFEAIAPSSLIS